MTSTRPTSEYQRLPECIRQYYTEREYNWLSDAQKARLIESELEPEYVE